ncbi:MAG: hypothetical protein SFV23_26390 [Planctomycetaceae bacterium]|nr:hypothetical protein [Planctomycetaceae bacterium]
MAKSPLEPLQVDPELQRQLASAAADGVVGAVLTLRTPPGRAFLTAAETQSVVDEILQTLTPAQRASVRRWKVFANTQSFALDAPPALIQRLLLRPDVASAIADRQSETLLIEPLHPTDAGAS